MGCCTSLPLEGPKELSGVLPTVLPIDIPPLDVTSNTPPCSPQLTKTSNICVDEYLNREFQSSTNQNICYVFNDILDDKHMKYMDRYKAEETVFWGIGVENETYFMLEDKCDIRSFRNLKQKSERYSVDYFKNFKPERLQHVIQSASALEQLTYPVYVNSHTFQKTDTKLRHRTLYDANSTPNCEFTESIHDILLRECPYYREVYDKSVVFDGDSIEFITQRFYNGTVQDCVNELTEMKQRTQQAVSPFFKKWGIGSLLLPDHNYGFATFLTTRKANMAICNSGTIHVNITLPTLLKNGCIVDKNSFAKKHLNYIQYIQMMEPLFVACYGTPDVFSFLDPAYSIGSLRVSRSRYISLQTYDIHKPVNGKLLLMEKPSDPAFWYNKLASSPYFLNANIGYDVNFNKFKNHGVEIRFFDWFPEEYLTDVMNVFVLLAQHSFVRGECSLDKSRYTSILLDCVKKGFTARLTSDQANVILGDLGLPLSTIPQTPFQLLSSISDQLFDLYHGSDLIQKMSPHMIRPRIVDYNQLAFQDLYMDLFGKPELVIRSELNACETRAPIVPHDVPGLLSAYRVKVESSSTRCYSDQEYKAFGANIVPAGYWKKTTNSFVIGLKAINAPATPTQTLLQFAHCFKGQEGSKETLDLIRKCTFIDYEYMTDRDQKRVISFCAQSGKIGCYLALMTFHLRQSGLHALPEFDEGRYVSMLTGMEKAPRVLLIGYGVAGKRAKEVLDQFNITTTVWTSKDVPDRSAILDHDILIHAIRLPDDPSRMIEPFLKPSDLLNDHRLSVICDISCDLGNPRNTLPLYDSYTTVTQPVRRIDGSVDLIAINHLPSLEPVVSSRQFSAILRQYLPSLRFMKHDHLVDPFAASLYQSFCVFQGFIR